MLALPTEIKSRILETHIELVKIFFTANDLKDVYITSYPETYFEGTEDEIVYKMLSLTFYSNTETSEQITFMSMRHAGFLNMINDFLLKCGVSAFELEPDPKSDKEKNEKKRRDKELDEEQKLRRETLNRDFEEHMKKIGLR